VLWVQQLLLACQQVVRLNSLRVCFWIHRLCTGESSACTANSANSVSGCTNSSITSSGTVTQLQSRGTAAGNTNSCSICCHLRHISIQLLTTSNAQRPTNPRHACRRNSPACN
jgi:hypothetical protein